MLPAGRRGGDTAGQGKANRGDETSFECGWDKLRVVASLALETWPRGSARRGRRKDENDGRRKALPHG